MKNIATAILCLFIFISLSCSSSKTVNKIDNITSKQWSLSTINVMTMDNKSPDYQNPYMTLSPDNGFSGFTGCNSFTGTYKYESGKLSLDPGAITKMHCGESIEMEFLSLLRKVSGFDVRNNTLVLLDGSDVLMTFISK
ncbi:MAG: META domain-containing protein [Candidatus Kapaibacterium sp.]